MEPHDSASFVVAGSGGHGRVVADLVRAAGHQVAGYVDADPAMLGCVIDRTGTRVVMSDDELHARLAAPGPGTDSQVEIDAVALGVGDNTARQRLLSLLSGAYVPHLVHPRATVSAAAEVGRGTVVFAAAVLNAGACTGRGVIVNSAAVIEHDCILGDAVHVSPGAVLSGGVRVGERSWIGAGATVIQGLSIGADSIVGAGAVVIRDVPDRTTVVGNPARPIARRPHG